MTRRPKFPPETGRRIRDAWPDLYDPWPAWMRMEWVRHGREIALFVEGATPSSVPICDAPSVYLSKRCSDFPESRDFTRALITATTNHTHERQPTTHKEHSHDQRCA